MKIVLIVVAALIVLVLTVVVTGALLPKRHVSSRIARFHASPQQLFALIAGPQNWRPDVAECEDIQDGSGRHLQRETNRRHETITYELLAVEPPRSIQRRIATPNLPYSGSWTFVLTPAANGTTVRITEDGEVYNPVFRFVTRFILGETATIDAYLRALGKATGQDVQPEN
jgi:Polyketide cyclase / dehydrase and lipid transport